MKIPIDVLQIGPQQYIYVTICRNTPCRYRVQYHNYSTGTFQFRTIEGSFGLEMAVNQAICDQTGISAKVHNFVNEVLAGEQITRKYMEGNR
jgi:hypothetical protein